jgi:hypothetical protein
MSEFRGADCNNDHYLVVEKLRERISISERAAQKFHMQRLDLKKQIDAEVKASGHSLKQG